MVVHRFAYVSSFVALTVLSALAVNRFVHPSLSTSLLLAAGLALVAGAPGLIHHRAALASLVLLPLGAYVLLRLASPLPAGVHGLIGQYHYFVDELSSGARAYASETFPFAISELPGLRALLLLAVYVVCGVAATLGLGGGQPLAGSALLLILLAFCFTVDGRRPDAGTAALFVALLVMALVASEGMARRHWGLREAGAGLVIGGLGVLAAVTLLASAPALATKGWGDWRVWRPFGSISNGTMGVFNWKQDYQRLLDPADNFVVMRVSSPQPSYWRATTLEEFTGDSWIGGDSTAVSVSRGYGLRRLPSADGLSSPPGLTIVERFDLEGISTSYLFVGGVADRLQMDGPRRVYVTGSGTLHLDRAVGPGTSYLVTAMAPSVQPEELVGLGRNYPAAIRERDLQLPLPTAEEVRAARAAGKDWRTLVKTSGGNASEFVGIYDLNEMVIAGATDPYDIALRVERFLRTSYKYSLKIPASDLRSPIAAFLLDTHTGYCQHFAGAMALLLRLNGVPARVAVGFTTGELVAENTYVVSSNNAHSWVEAYFPGFGWLPFDPTAGNSFPYPGVSSASPGFVDPYGGEHADLPTPPAPQIPDRTRVPEEAGPPAIDAADLPRSRAYIGWVVGLGGLGAGVMAWPFVRARYRTRSLRSGGGEERLLASLRLLRGDLAAWGKPIASSWTADQLAEAVLEDLNVDLRPLVSRAQAVTFGGYPATLSDVSAAEALRRQVGLRMRQQEGWWRAVVAWYGLSAFRRGAVHRWWSASRHRWRLASQEADFGDDYA